MRLFNPFKRYVVASKCGHTTALKGTVSAFGQSTITKIRRDQNGSTPYCLECLGGMAIRCAWCGNPIFIGDPITLYAPVSEESYEKRLKGQTEFFRVDYLGMKLPKGSVVYGEKPYSLVGCLRWKCADTGADRAGFWLPGSDGKGTVHRIKTVYEEFLTSDKKYIGIDDLSDMRGTTPSKPGDVRLPTIRFVG